MVLNLTQTHTMRRASSVLLFRTLAAARGGSAASIPVSNRFLQSTLYGTTAGSSPIRRRWFSSILATAAGTSLAVGGALIAASSISEGALAKEPPPPHTLPKDVVLYQYEACPFCNKVKGLVLCEITIRDRLFSFFEIVYLFIYLLIIIMFFDLDLLNWSNTAYLVLFNWKY